MGWDEEDFTKCPIIDNTAQRIEELLKDNDKEILINAVRIRIVQNRLSLETSEQKQSELNNALSKFKRDRQDLYDGRQMLADWLAEEKKN